MVRAHALPIWVQPSVGSIAPCKRALLKGHSIILQNLTIWIFSPPKLPMPMSGEVVGVIRELDVFFDMNKILRK